ncbi:MAG: LamG-like jellyroll fold domain-containing protein [Candidatus Peribacteraceae bacterium]
MRDRGNRRDLLRSITRCALLLFLSSTLIPSALAATRTWDGGGSTSNWSEAANWSDNTAPTAADTAVFDGTDATDATVDADINLAGLTVTSGYGGTLNLGSSYITGTVGDGAVQFTAADKSNFYIANASVTGLSPGVSDSVVAFWYKPASVATIQRLFRFGGGSASTAGYEVALNTSEIFAAISNGTTRLTATSTTTLSVGTWYYLVVHFDRDGNLAIYVNNGAAEGNTDISSLAASNITVAANLYMGHGGGDTHYADGVMDSLGVWIGTPPTASEKTWLYNSGNGKVYADIGIAGTNGSNLKTSLVSWWDLGENAGTRYDSHGTNHLSQSFANIIAPPVYGSELLTNGGFETAGAGGADVFGTWTDNVDDGAIDDETTLVQGGGHAAKLTRNTSGPTVTQDVAVTAGAIYRFSFWTRGDGTNAGRYYVYDATNGVYIGAITQTGITSTAYTLFTYDFTAPTGCTSVRVSVIAPTANGGIAYFDDVSLKQITTAAINNGGFEDWTTATDAGTWTESVSGTSTVNREDTAPYHGTYAARLDVDASGNLATVRQYTLTLNKLYNHSFYAKSLSGTPSVRTGTYGASSAVPHAFQTHTFSTAYSNYTGTFRASGGTQFGFTPVGTASNSIYIDSVTLTAAEILGTTGIPRGQGAGVDYAGQFNGTDQYVNATTGTWMNPGTGDFSIGASFYADKLPADISLLYSGVWGTTNDFYNVLVRSTGKIRVQFNDSSGTPFDAVSSAVVTAGTWNSVIVNFDRDGNVTATINNVIENFGSISDKSTSVDSGNGSTTGFTIGRVDGGSNGSFFPGRINNAFYSNRLLTEDEITYLHNNGKGRGWNELGLAGTNGANLTSSVVKGFWDFQNAGNLGADASGNGNNMTNNGTVTQGTGNTQYTGGAEFVFDHPGTLNLSSATLDLKDARLDVADVGTILPGTSSFLFRGISTLSGSSLQRIGNVSVLSTAVLTQKAPTSLSSLTVSGSYVISTGTLTVSGSLLLPGIFTHGSNALTLTGAGSRRLQSGGNSLFALTLSGSGIYDLQDALTLTSALNLSGATLDLNGQTLTVTGASFANEGTLRLQGSETLTGFTNDSDSGTVTYDGTSGPYTLKPWTYQNLTLNGAATVFSLPSALDLNGNLAITAGTLDVTASNFGLTVGGNWTNDGTFTARAGTVTLDGTSTLTPGGTGNAFYALSLAGAVTLNGTGLISSALTVQTGATLSLSSFPLTATSATILNFGTVTEGTGKLIHEATATILDAGGEDLATITTDTGIIFSVTDADANLQGSLQDTLSVTVTTLSGDSETLTLTETGNATGIFRLSTVLRRINPLSPGNAVLETHLPTTLTLTYEDSQDGLTATDTATASFPTASSSTTSSEETQASGGGGGGGGVRSTTLSNRLDRANAAIASRFEDMKKESGEIAVEEEERREVAQEENAGKMREQRMQERVAEHERPLARLKREEEILQKAYAERRQERIKEALLAKEQELQAKETALRLQEELLAKEKEENRLKREQRIAEKEQRKNAVASTPAPGPDTKEIAERRNRLFVLVDASPVLFKDVLLDAWYSPYVSYVIGEKIAEGYRDAEGKPKGEFGVENPVTYAEVLKMALEAAAVSLEGAPPPRNLSAKNLWASAYVGKAEQMQLTVFVPTLDVNAPATRGAVVQTILETLKMHTDIKLPSPYTDVPEGSPFAKAIITATAYGLVQGDTAPDGTVLNRFRPNDPIKRAEVAKIIALVQELK